MNSFSIVWWKELLSNSMYGLLRPIKISFIKNPKYIEQIERKIKTNKIIQLDSIVLDNTKRIPKGFEIKQKFKSLKL